MINFILVQLYKDLTSESSRLTRATLLCDVIAYPRRVSVKLKERMKKGRKKKKTKQIKMENGSETAETTTTTTAEQGATSGTAAAAAKLCSQGSLSLYICCVLLHSPVWLSLLVVAVRERKRSRHAKVMSLLQRVRLPYSACIPSSHL